MVPGSSDTNNKTEKKPPRSIYRLTISIIVLIATAAFAAGVWRYAPIAWSEIRTLGEERPSEKPPVATCRDLALARAELRALRQMGAQAEEELQELKRELSLTRVEVLLLMAERISARGYDSTAKEYLREALMILEVFAQPPQTTELKEAIEADIAMLEQYADRSPQRVLPLIDALLNQHRIPQRFATATSPTLVHKVLDYLPQRVRGAVTIRRADDARLANEHLLNFLLVARVAALDGDREKYQASIDSVKRLAERFGKDASLLLALDKLTKLDIEWQHPRLRSVQRIYARMKR